MGRPRACDEGVVKRGRRGRPKKKVEVVAVRTGFDGQIAPPWRKTVSIFKQPVTLAVTSNREWTKKQPTDAQVRRGTGTGKSEFKPFPILWAKSLQGLSFSSPLYVADKVPEGELEHQEEHLQSLAKFTPVSPILDESATAATVFNTLHNPLQPGAFGQSANDDDLKANIIRNSDPNQPMVSAISITSEDISAQERRVLNVRKRLQEIMKHFG